MSSLWDACSFFVSLLRKCNSLEDIRRLHQQLLAYHLHTDKYVGNTLVQLYGTFGCLDSAFQAFDAVLSRNVYSWSLLMSAFAQSRHLDGVLNVFDLSPQRDLVCWTTAVSACTQGQRLDLAASIFKQMPQRNLVSWNILATAYVQSGYPDESLATLSRIPQLSLISWNVVLQAYAQMGDLQAAWNMFQAIPDLDAMSWTSMLNAFAKNGDLSKASELFDAMPCRDFVSWNCLLQANANAGNLAAASSMFEKMPQRDSMSWNAVILASVEQDKMLEARECFLSMPSRCIVSWTVALPALAEDVGVLDVLSRMPAWDTVSWNNAIVVSSDFASSSAANDPMTLFLQMPCRNAASWHLLLQGVNAELASLVFDRAPALTVGGWTSMMGALAQAGDLEQMRGKFEAMPDKDLVAWNVAIVAYAKHGYPEEALLLFKLLDNEGMKTDTLTVARVVHACASVECFEVGKLIHSDMVEAGLDLDLVLATALLHMYGKFGYPEMARSMFQQLQLADSVSWNTMLSAYSQNGDIAGSKELFIFMRLEGVPADPISFICLLSACSHSGKVQDAHSLFLSMVEDHSICPIVDHYQCMVDALGRAGLVAEAEELIHCMPLQADCIGRTTLLGACANQQLQWPVLDGLKRNDERPPKATYSKSLRPP